MRRRTLLAELVNEGIFESPLAYGALFSHSPSMLMQWATDSVGLIPSIQNLGALQGQLNALFDAILTDLQVLKNRA